MLQRRRHGANGSQTASMATKHCYRHGFLLLLFNFMSTAALERRFSDFKRCADQECSMLLCRGKAVRDFLGPDCRFLSFKKSETIYVYYKLSGKRADLWAGSVGSNFGYFPKDLLAVNHRYTDQEVEIPAEETDFVCFDTGNDKFDSYDIDLLLGSSINEDDSDHNVTSVGKAATEAQPPAEERAEPEMDTKQSDFSDVHIVPDDQSASLLKLDQNTSDLHVLDDVGTQKDDVPEQEVVQEQISTVNVSGSGETKDKTNITEPESITEEDPVAEPVSDSEGAQIPDFKTTFGTTFDAIVTDDENTTKVTLYEEEDDNEDMEGKREEEEEEVAKKEESIPLLPFSKEPVVTPELDSATKQEQGDETPAAEEKTLWTSLGDAMLSVVTGGEMTPDDVSSDEDDDEDYNEETLTEPQQSLKKEPEALKAPENMVTVSKNANTLNTESERFTDRDRGAENVFDVEDEIEDGTRHEEEMFLKPSDEPIPHPVENSSVPEELLSQDDIVSLQQNDKILETTVSEEEKEPYKESEDIVLDDDVQDEVIGAKQVFDYVLDNNDTVTEQEPSYSTSEKDQELLFEKKELNKANEKDYSQPDDTDDALRSDVESNNSNTGKSLEEIHNQTVTKHEGEKEAEIEEKVEEELLEDENALLSSQSSNINQEKAEDEPAEEPEYSDSILRLTLLRQHFTGDKMERVQKLLGLANLYKVEALFSDLDTELQSSRRAHTGATQDIENALESILEASENSILDEIEKMLDSRDTRPGDEQSIDQSSLDEETEMLDDFQELAFRLRQKYSTASDSVPLAAKTTSNNTHDDPEFLNEEDASEVTPEQVDVLPVSDREEIALMKDQEESRAESEAEQTILTEEPSKPEDSTKEDAEAEANKDHQPIFNASDEKEKLPEVSSNTLVDTSVDPEVEVEHSVSEESLDSVETVTEVPEEQSGIFSNGIVYMGCILSVIQNKTVQWTTEMISLLPEEWKPGDTLFGCPWQAVVVTALVGMLTFTMFFWKTVLAVKTKKYLVDEKKLEDKIQALKKEKNDALAKVSELQKQTEQLKENQKQSKETVTITKKVMQELESKVIEAKKNNEQMMEERNKYAKLLEEEHAMSLKNETRIEHLEKSKESLQASRKKIQDALAKTTVLLEEAKIRENARNAQHKCLQNEFTAVKEENKTLKATIKDWEQKHRELNEKIKLYQKSQKELEDSLALKDHNLEVLSELLTDLDACDASQKGEANTLANGEITPDKKTILRNRIKQMMDISRVQTTLNVVEEERDRFMAKLLNEEKSRKELEEKHQELEHAIGALKSEKSQIESQFKILQQKNEIMVEMYQQKENTLQQRLTKEELERRSKENLLSEVGGKAVEAEEQVKLLRQRINEMEEQMKKTEEVYKGQIKEQELKTHSNWITARNAERALSQEKLEGSKLREKLAVLTSKLNERRAPLCRPNSGQPSGPRQGDSYGPSPVSGGAPSPPIMIEGPRRPPSAPVGRRIDPYGPRPPSDPHGCYAESKHIAGMEMMGPRSSSPANLDGSNQAADPEIKTDTQVVASTENPEAAPGSFIVSPIRDSPGPMVGPLHDPLLPPGPNIRMPPPGPYRAPRPGPYQMPPAHFPPNVPPLPANGHPGLPMSGPGPIAGEFGSRPANGHIFQPRPGPGPLPPHFRPPPPHFGPMPPPFFVRGPLGPRPPVPHDMRLPVARDHASPPMEQSSLVPPLPADSSFQPSAQNSAGPQTDPRQDLRMSSEAPRDSRPAMAEP